MKAHPLILLIMAPSTLVWSQTTERRSGIGPEMIPKEAGSASADITTDQDFIALRNAASGESPEPKPIPPKPSAYSLLEMSTAIQSGTDFMLVPKGSVIWCPKQYQEKIVSHPVGKFVGWTSFVTANRNWITTLEVTKDQAFGKTPIAPEILERHHKGNLVVIATLNGSPITLIPHQP
jgi:hypothetical protein